MVPTREAWWATVRFAAEQVYRGEAAVPSVTPGTLRAQTQTRRADECHSSAGSRDNRR
jgi:hypothetical protein